MNFSFLKALRASVRLTHTTFKRDSKRLQRASGEVFGQAYSLSTCQEAYARARGFRNWREADVVMQRGGGNSGAPFWKIDSRTDAHAAVFSSIVTSELEMTENGPVCFFGQQGEAVIPALCLWAESLSLAEVPGIILVDTKATALQDTSLWDAVTLMGLQWMFDDFRYIDARCDNIPLALSGTANGWTSSLLSALPADARTQLYDSGFAHLLEQTIAASAAQQNHEGGQVFPGIVESALQSLCRTSPTLPPGLRKKGGNGTAHDSLLGDLEAYIDRQRPAAIAELAELNSSLSKKGMSLGRVLAQESKHRPTVVLFDSSQRASLVVASLVHSQYYERYAGMELRSNGIATRPVLYFSDVVAPQIPRFINESGAGHTCLVTGPGHADGAGWPEHRSAKAYFVHIEGETLVYSGRRTSFATTALAPDSAAERA